MGKVNRIFLSPPHMCGEELKYIREAFDTNWIAPLGPNVDAFEKELADYIGHDRRVVALSSGTAAIHLALILLGVGPGDEVICQSFTFAASVFPVSYVGAKPVFADSEKDTWNMDPVLLEEAIKERLAATGKLPKAIIPVHLYGMPAAMDKILEIAAFYKIPVIEDAAEALGAEFNSRRCGSFGDFGILSFNGNKIITTSGGGALVCKTEEEANKTRFYATQARDSAPHYEHSEIGYNYRMSNICAGVGRGQMLALEKHIERRKVIHRMYKKLLAQVNGVTVMDKPSEKYDSNFWLTCIIIQEQEAGFSREDLRQKLEAENIESRPLWKPMHLQPVFSNLPFYGNNTSENLFNTGLCLPSGSSLTDEDILHVTEVIKSI